METHVPTEGPEGNKVGESATCYCALDETNRLRASLLASLLLMGEGKMKDR
jgi:hypothetical protein